MSLAYIIPAGKHPEEKLQSFYQKRDDGSYQLAITGLPETPSQPSDEVAKADNDSTPSHVQPHKAVSSQASDIVHQPTHIPSPRGAGSPPHNGASAVVSQIAAHDSTMIASSLHGLASGAVRIIGTGR